MFKSKENTDERNTAYKVCGKLGEWNIFYSKERYIPHSLATSYFKMDQKRIMDSETESGHKTQEYLQRISELFLEQN